MAGTQISLRSPDGRLIAIRPIRVVESRAEADSSQALIGPANRFEDDDGRCYQPMADERGFLCVTDELVYERLLQTLAGSARPIVDVPPVSRSKYQDHELPILNLVNHPIIADPDPVQIRGAAQFDRSGRPGIVG